MESSEDTAYFVDRKEVVLNSTPASQINVDKTPVQELAAVEVDVSNDASSEAQSSHSSVEHLKTGKFERSEVSVEIQGLRETTLSISETVVSSRVRTVYGRSLSGSTSSAEFEHAESSGDSQQETEHPVFGENAYLDGEQRERKISDSYYISQTYQINAQDRESTSQTSVKCVNFKSSKDFEVGSHENANEDAAVHYVDRVEEIIAGENPEAMGSPKEKHVRFLWFDSEQEDVEAQKRLQSARESVQQLIESTNMVCDIIDVVNDNYMGPESKQLKPSTSDHFPAEGGSEWFAELGRGNTGNLHASVETTDLNLLAGSASITTQVTYTQASSAGNTTDMTRYKSLASSEVTSSLSTAYSSAGDSSQIAAASVEKPTDFPTEFEPVDSLTTERGSPLALAYSPGMAIRNYALEELEEKRYRVSPDRSETEARSSPDRSETEAKSLRFDEKSSGVDVDKGSSVDDFSILTALSRSELSITSAESYSTDSLSSQRFAVQTGKTPFQEMSREEEDESLDKLVDLESIQVGYRFHDVGIMQEYGGICNLAFDDSDEQETANSSEDRTSSLQSLGTVNNGILVSETASGGSSEVLSRSLVVAEKSSVTLASGGSSEVLSRSQVLADKSSVTLESGSSSEVLSRSLVVTDKSSVTLESGSSSEVLSRSLVVTDKSSVTLESGSSSEVLSRSQVVTDKSSVTLESGSSSEVLSRSLVLADKSSVTLESSGSSEVLPRSQLGADKDSVTSDTSGYHSSVEHATSFLAESAGSSTISQNISRQSSSFQQSSSSVTSAFTTEVITRTSEFSTKEINTNSTSYSSQVDQTRTTFQTEKSVQHWNELLNTAGDQEEQKAGDSVDDTDFVKELDSVIEAGEKAIQKIAESLEISDYQKAKNQNFPKEAEDLSSRIEAESAQNLQAGGYQSRNTSVEGRSDVHLYPASESALQGKPGEFGEEAEDWSRRKEAVAIQSLQAGGYQSGYTSVEGRSDVNLNKRSQSATEGKTGESVEDAENWSRRKEAEAIQSLQAGGYQSGYTRVVGSSDVHLYPASDSALEGKTVDQPGEEDENVAVYGIAGASTVDGDVPNEDNVEKTHLINETEAYGDSTQSSIHNVAETTLRVSRGENTEHSVVTNSTAFAMESASTLYRQEIQRTQVIANRQANEVSRTGRASYIREANQDLDMSDSRAGLNKVDTETVNTDSKDITKVTKVDNLESGNKYISVTTRKDDSAVISKEDQLAAGVVETEDINTVLEVVNDALVRDVGVNISDVNSRTQQAVETLPARNVSVQDGHKKDLQNRSGAVEEPDLKAQLGQMGSESVDQIIQATVASEHANAQSNVGVAVGGGEYLRSDTVSVKETSKRKKARSKGKSRIEEASKSKGTSRNEEASRIEEVSKSKETSSIEDATRSKGTSSIEASRSKGKSGNEEASRKKGKSRNEEASRNKETSRIEEASKSKETSRIEEASRKKGKSRVEEASKFKETSSIDEASRSKGTSSIEASRFSETSRIEEARSSETSRIEESSRSNETSRIEESLRSKGTSRIEEVSRSKETSRTDEASIFKETSQIEETSRTKTTPVQNTATLQAKKQKQPSYVTRKFNVSKKFEAALKAQGAVLKSESISIAVYYDTPEFTLTLSDCWLRSVNSKFQFHSSFTKLLNELTKHEYSEAEDKEVILSSLAALLKCPVPVDAESSIAVFVQRSGLREFVRYTTEHKTYLWRGLTIQLELPEYGFWVGSVTVPASGRAELHEAVSLIDSLWRCTGVEALNLLGA